MKLQHAMNLLLRLGAGCVGLVLGLCSTLLAQQQSYVNYGYVYSATNIPQAVVSFTNQGYIGITGAWLNDYPGAWLPFETLQTLNFRNRPGTFPNSGTMICTPGWRFNYRSATTGERRPAAYFQNDNGAVIIAQDPVRYFSYIVGYGTLPCRPAPVDQSYLFISATNVTVKGATVGVGASLVVGSYGLLDISGVNVNLQRAGLEVLPVWVEALGGVRYLTNNTPIAFVPDLALWDQYWDVGSYSANYSLNTAGLWDGVIARNPGTPNVGGFALIQPEADSYIEIPYGSIMAVTLTNISGPPDDVSEAYTVILPMPTNVIKGAVFVSVPSDFGVELAFQPGTVLGRPIEVLIYTTVTNVVTASDEWAYLYIEDSLGSTTNRGLIPNVIGCAQQTYMPMNYYVSRLPELSGSSGDGPPPPDFFTTSGNGLFYPDFVWMDWVTNPVVQNGDYSAYSAYADNVVARPALVPGATATVLPGKVCINATNLDLSWTRIRAEGYLKIQSSHLISCTNAVIDCENLGFDLNSTNGFVSVQNMAPRYVQRLKGPIYLWSAVWSNSALVIITNNYVVSNIVQEIPSPDGTTTNYVTNLVAFMVPLTNTVAIRFHTLMVDATQLRKVVPVYVDELVSRATNAIIRDDMTLTRSALFLGRSLTIEGSVTIPGMLPSINPTGLSVWETAPALWDWCYTNAPNLLYFTNRGYFSIPNEAHFGDDGPRRYEVFHNSGTIEAASIHVSGAQVENRGVLRSAGYQRLVGDVVRLESGQNVVGGDLTVAGKSVKITNYTAQVNAALEFIVTNSLADAGVASGNTINVLDGFRLLVKPQVGDLLGTTINTYAPEVYAIEVQHIWAGSDLGPVPAGYSNNAALGVLRLISQSMYPLFRFTGTGTRNAIYVDLLDISALGEDYAWQMEIDDNFVIYYASARLGFTPPPHPNGQPQLPEEYLDGQFGGRLRWVRDFAGPRSSVPVLVDGKTVYVNRALRESRVIDSDGDGLPNYYDSSPFGGLSLIASLVPRTNSSGPYALQETGTTPDQLLAISWYARTNAVYEVQFTTNLGAGEWCTLLRTTNSDGLPRWITVYDTNALGRDLQRYYRVSEQKK